MRELEIESIVIHEHFGAGTVVDATEGWALITFCDDDGWFAVEIEGDELDLLEDV